MVRSSIARSREAQFQAAVSGSGSPIVHRRSGKSTVAVPAGSVREPRPDGWLFPNECSDPTAILTTGKATARAFVSALNDEDRLAQARLFCAHLIQTYWLAVQRPYRDAWAVDSTLWAPPEKSVEGEMRGLAEEMGEAAAKLDPIVASYLIGSTYTAMIPDQTRSRLGVYYTPPGLARRLLDMATLAGVDWRSAKIIDPACGGGAFLAPVAVKVAAENGHLGASQLVKMIADRIRGFEIDPFAAWASQVFLESSLMALCRTAGERIPPLVQIRNTLLTDSSEGAYDLVVGNPPYGRVTLSPEVRERFRRSLYGHANLYGLFTDLAVRLARPGGVIAYVTPTSFLAGEYFKSLRNLLATEAPPLNLDFVSDREGVFDDVLQETLLATYRRGGKADYATVHFITPSSYDQFQAESSGTFRPGCPLGAPWLIPRSSDQQELIGKLRVMRHRLSDYGYDVSTGPLVWNRHKSQLASTVSDGTLPLIWAECVTADGRFVFRADKKNHQPYFKPRAGDEWLISRKPCVLLQRTTAKEQTRRLIAAELPRRFLSTHGAVVIENHLNMVRPRNGAPPVAPRVLTAFLNSGIIDRAFRCLSGSVAVSAYELEALPLPPPESLEPLARLVANGASREEIEDTCTSVFLARGGVK
jgi:adenine-specific DNA-methyltransferase